MLTVVLPTQNRPEYLSRALEYYGRSRCAYPIVVCDSSDDARRDDVAAIVQAAHADVHLERFPFGMPVVEKLVHSAHAVATPLLVFAADDDFIVPSSMQQCGEFLEAHPDYAVAHGKAFTFAVEGAVPRGSVTSVRPYRQRSLAQARAVDRLRDHFRDWTTSFYSVQRTAHVREILETFTVLKDITACEVYYYAASVIRGKAAKLDCPYMYRQLHVAKEHVSFDTHLWADTPGWTEIRDALAREIGRELTRAEPHGMTEPEAFARQLIVEWVDGRRPYALSQWRNYPLRYYWERTQNLGHKLGLRMREHWNPSPEGRVVRAIVEARA